MRVILHILMIPPNRGCSSVILVRYTGFMIDLSVAVTERDQKHTKMHFSVVQFLGYVAFAVILSNDVRNGAWTHQ